MIDADAVLEKAPIMRDLDPVPVIQGERNRKNPRLVYSNPDDYFGREFYHDLLMEQQEQQ
jgi:hypothetical protein